MSKIIASAAIRGAHKYVKQAEEKLKQAIESKGEGQKAAFPDTAYYLPVIYAFIGLKVETLGDMKQPLEYAKGLLPPVPSENVWLPYLGNTLDAGMATLIAQEIIEALKYVIGPNPVEGIWLGATTDAILRTQGIKLVDGRMPGFAACVGACPSVEDAVKLARELQEKSILVFMASNSNGISMAEQLGEAGIEMGWDTFLVPYGKETSAAVYALGFAARAAMTFGGVTPGDMSKARDILLYNKNRVFAFALALGKDNEVDEKQLLTDEKYATAAGAINYGFPVISNVGIPEILPTGICTYEHVVSNVAFDKFVSRAVEVRGLKLKITKIPIPVPYGAGFEGERVRKEEMQLQFGSKYSSAFELVRSKPMDDVEDGRIELIGPDIDSVEAGGAMHLGLVVDVAGRKLQKDFESILERHIHHFLSCANGLMHTGQRDVIWYRISKDAFEKGLRLKHFGEIIRARFLEEFPAIVDKIQVTIYTEKEKVEEIMKQAQAVYNERDNRVASMTDEDVETFYSCTLCVPEGENIIFADGSFDSVEDVIFENDWKKNVFSLNSGNLLSKAIGELFINPAPKTINRVTLSSGNRILLTANHKVLRDSTRNLEWVEVSKLQKGDVLLSPGINNTDGQNGQETSSTNFYLIDYLPDETRVSDNKFLLKLRKRMLEKYKNMATCAKNFGLAYHRLYGAFYFKDTKRYRLSYNRLSLSQIRTICESVGWRWDEAKKEIRVFGFSNSRGYKIMKNTLDEDTMYMAGLIASDGCVRHRGRGTSVQFTNTNKTLIDKFGDIVYSLFGKRAKTYTFSPAVSSSPVVKIVGKKQIFVSVVNNAVIGKIMLGLGIGREEKSSEGKVKWKGNKISSLSNNLIAAFIRGLFDGDGHVTKDHIVISTGKYEEAQHVFLLLKKLGIQTYISKTTRGFQVGTRSHREFLKFYSLISSNHPDKRERMNNVDFNFDDNHVVRTERLPFKCGKILKELIDRYRKNIYLTKLAVDYKTITAWVNGKCRASIEKMKLLLESIKDEAVCRDTLYQELLKWANLSVQFEKVKKIERIDCPGKAVYNFSVPETHNYLVNSVVVKNCQSYAPNHVCIISPERLGLCGAYSWLDGKAAYEINPHGANQPVEKGECLEPVKGQWKGINEIVSAKSNGAIEKFNAYSIVEDPETSCGCFECIVAVLPEANGVMIVNREFSGMTPVGMPFSTLAGSVGGGMQTPGFIGIGKLFISSAKFISAEGGAERIVWMPKELKDAVEVRLRKRFEQIGKPDVFDKIADETIAETTEDLVPYLEKMGHPALTMDPIM